ncbi:MAG: hypothetical protein WEB09_05505 [Nitriliruptor sp.]
MRVIDVLITMMAGAAGAVLAAVLVGASLVLIVPAVAGVGVITLLVDRARRAS